MADSKRDTRVRAPGAGVVASLVFVIALAVLVWVGVADRGKAMAVLARETHELTVPTVAIVRPSRGAAEEGLVLPGTTQAYMDAPIYARTSGYLKRRYVEMGSRVKANQLLAELDAPELEQQIQQARADLATADANAKLAQLTADRYRELAKTDSVSQQDADNAVGTLDARRTTVESARFNVKRLEDLQSYTRIYAPFAGVITARNTDVGALIDPGSSGGATRELFHISATDRLRLFVNLPEVYAQAATPGLTASLTLAEFPGRKFPATLVRTSGTIDVASRTLLVEFDVPNRGGTLLAGAYAEVHLKVPASAAVFRLPADTLMFRADGLKIAVVGDGEKIVMTTVVVGRDFGTEVEVLSGVAGNDRIVVNPADSLAAGQAVRVLAAAKATGEGAKR